MFSHSLPYIAPYKVQYRTKLGDRPEHPYQMSFNDTRNNYKFKGVKYEDFVKYFNHYGCSYSRANFYDNY
ncbi:hypothetical protein P8452_38468 [Trifolium repens]|nr:hypothetical protein P8452_38468 [Trifolium repens]